MNKRIIPSCMVLLVFITLLFACGDSVKPDDGEGFVYDTIPIFEKDTFIYPLATRSSGHIFPELFFGEVKTIDGDYGTAWQTIPGLVTGEYIEFDFDSLYIADLSILYSSEIRFAKVKNILLYADRNFLGSYPIDARIPVARKVNNLRIELGETEGLNKVEIPFSTDSSGNIETTHLFFESYYASKSAAIFEIFFSGENSKSLPIRSIQVKKVKMNLYGTEQPLEINNARLMFDGRRDFGWKGSKTDQEKTILFSFEEDQIVDGLFFPYSDGLNLLKFGFRLRKRDLPEYKIELNPKGTGIFVKLNNTLKGKNFEFVILETQNNEAPYIPELLFHDGSRLFGTYSDSLQYFQTQRTDSAQNTPLADYIDSRITAKRGWKEYAHPLYEIYSKNKKITDTLPTKTVNNEVIFRVSSNGTFSVRETKNITDDKDNNAEKEIVKYAEGYWIAKEKSTKKSVITCYANLHTNEKIPISGKEPVISNTKTFINFTVTLERNHIYFSGHFPALTTGY